MSDILCVYCSRTGSTKKIMETAAERLGADLARITDGVNRDGPLGYANAAVAALKKTPPEILAVNTPKPVSEYKTIILGAPIWAETVCPLAKGFLRRYMPLLEGDVYYIITHMAPDPYESAIMWLDAYLGKTHKAHLSVSTKAGDFTRELDRFLEEICQ